MNNAQTILIPSELVKILKSAKSVVALTGAGVSAESGISTFRDPNGGLFTKYNVEEVATPEGFKKNPKLVWEWYSTRREKVRKAQPNPGHVALARLEKIFPNFTLITQNVDGLHQKAGSKNVIELHGNIMRNKCFANSHPVDIEKLPISSEIPPQCPICGSPVRPDVVWFGEFLDPDILSEAEKATKNADLFLSIGTSSVVYPAAGFISLAKEFCATVVEINPNETEKSYCADFVFRHQSGKILPVLLDELIRHKNL
ncbi:MAG: SIR2 family NAD-dependent protein deacylase [Verrucomicrobiia bacterium]